MASTASGIRVERTPQGWMARDELRRLAWLAASEEEARSGLEAVTRRIDELASRWAEWHRDRNARLPAAR